MEQELPYVTAMIVVRNEETYIKQAILSFLNQEYPKDRMELLLIDGMSEDRTVEQAEQAIDQYEKEHQKVKVRYLQNNKKNLAAGWNIGIRKAAGEYVVRIDAHAQADPKLISTCVNILREHEEVACAGGRLETAPMTPEGKTIADVLSSPFGVGNSRFRYSQRSGIVDTVAYGVYRKSIFDRAGYFNEEFQRNQDNDMHGRIKKCGGQFYLEASVKNLYHSRETVKGMIKQAYGNGRWILVGIKKSVSREGISLRHLIPLFFVTGQIIILTGVIFNKVFRYIFIAIYALYLGTAVYFAYQKTKKPLNIMKMACLYWLLHMSYGLGSLSEFLQIRIEGRLCKKKFL